MEEWTSADTGVGAAIAAGSQALNGIWALLVVAAKIIIKGVKYIILYKENDIQFPDINIQEIAKINKASPIRLVNAVNIPAASDLSFL